MLYWGEKFNWNDLIKIQKREGIQMINYLKKEKVLSISMILALLSAFFVHPDREYTGYVDVRVLALLFYLMLLVKGFQDVGLFEMLINRVCSKVMNSRSLVRMLLLITFFSSMLITNDVALITFVPFAILTLRFCHQERQMIPVVVLQTIAANLGSMCTPIGNPQNLYLFSTYQVELCRFFETMLPVTALSLVLLMIAVYLIPDETIQMERKTELIIMEKRALIVYSLLFSVNLLVVFRVIHWMPALVVTTAGVLFIKKQRLFIQVDYALLFTFIGFFIFVGNLGRIPEISSLLEKLICGREIAVAVLFSQFLSNVPAALLLSGFTENVQGLLIGTNIGGLGTLIASMASLISYKMYAAQEDADKGRYMLTFTACNFIGLAVLLVFCRFYYVGQGNMF
ncbi:MAG: citrate transporter [Clostridiales bacterium]|nr:citrate transporter [Clostridiales bacterium]